VDHRSRDFTALTSVAKATEACPSAIPHDRRASAGANEARSRTFDLAPSDCLSHITTRRASMPIAPDPAIWRCSSVGLGAPRIRCSADLGRSPSRVTELTPAGSAGAPDCPLRAAAARPSANTEHRGARSADLAAVVRPRSAPRGRDHGHAARASGTGRRPESLSPSHSRRS
jgi:hypothetical protein